MRKISGGWDAAKREEQFETFVALIKTCTGDEQIRAILKTIVTSSELAAIAQRLSIIRLVEKVIYSNEIIIF